MSANETQVAGGHYKKLDPQPWDVIAAWGLDWFQGAILKYVVRCHDKNGIEDLKKARHVLDKMIEIEEAKATPDAPAEAPLELDEIATPRVLSEPEWCACQQELIPAMQQTVSADGVNHARHVCEPVAAQGPRDRPGLCDCGALVLAAGEPKACLVGQTHTRDHCNR